MMAGPPKTKRNISKNFKNPPQPHMCIQDYITGSSIPCYINILSWEKVNLPDNPSQPVPMRGGMELNPPRNEDKNSRVFAVIANPEVLRIRGKNAKDQNDQSNLIEMLLNFVESKNKGVIFSRIYSILKDRDITGELKEVWNLIQSQESQVETWIDGQPSSSQYSQHLDQQQQQQQSQQQQQQQQQQPQQLQSQQPPQQISQQIPQQIQQQQQMQQTQHMIQNSYMMSQPPQYQSSVIYGPVSNNDCSNYDRYNYPQQSSVSVNQNDQVYQTNQILTLVNRSRVDPDRFSYHERGRLLPQQSFNKMHLPLPQQQQQQQNCPAYSAPQYHYQQISRHMMHYMNSNVNSNYNGQLNPVVNTHFADYMIMQQQHMTSRMEQRQMENQIHADVHRMQHQQQQEQMHMQPTHIQQPVPHYQTHGLNVVANSPMKSGKRGFGVSKFQHAIGPHKNNLGKRQNNSPTHPKQTYSLTGGTGVPQSRDSSGDNATKPKSPVKVLQRDPTLQNRQKVSQFSPEKNSKILEKNVDENHEACNIQVTDLDEDETKIKDISELTNAIAFKETEVLNYNILTREAKERIEYKQETKTQKTDGSTLHGEHPVRELREKCRHNEKQRSIKTVLKRNKSCANDVKVWAKDLKGPKNGIRSHFGQINLSGVEKLQDRGTDEHLKGVQQTLAEIDEGWNVRVKHKSSDSPKRAQSTVNSIIKSVFKINQGNNIAGDEVGTGKKQKSNGQVRANTKIAINQHEETNQGCTILKNSEGTTSTTMTVNTPEEVTNEIAQLKIQDCKGSAEKNAVFSL